ncbi:unnamed protein product [Closterium sp. Yama58-4]|nr:unnamed protein product [Closterium sp. Yama58-4]
MIQAQPHGRYAPLDAEQPIHRQVLHPQAPTLIKVVGTRPQDVARQLARQPMDEATQVGAAESLLGVTALQAAVAAGVPPEGAQADQVRPELAETEAAAAPTTLEDSAEAGEAETIAAAASVPCHGVRDAADDLTGVASVETLAAAEAGESAEHAREEGVEANEEASVGKQFIPSRSQSPQDDASEKVEVDRPEDIRSMGGGEDSRRQAESNNVGAGLAGSAPVAPSKRSPADRASDDNIWHLASGWDITSLQRRAYIASVTAAQQLLRQMNLPETYLQSRAVTRLSHNWTPPPPAMNRLTSLEEDLPADAKVALQAFREGPPGQGNLQLLLSKHINERRAAELLADTIIDRPGEDCGHGFSLALGFRLGLALPVTGKCPCKRENGDIDDTSLPNHLLRCGEGGDVVRTHNSLVYAALRMAREAGFNTFHETSVFSPPVIRKRADLAFQDRESAETWSTDVTVTNPVLQKRDKRARKPPGWAAKEASEKKHRLYEGRPDYVGFFGLAVETYGALATDTVQFLRLLATAAAKKKFRQGPLTTTASRLTAHYRQRWSVMLQRSQATSFMNKSNMAAEAAYPQALADPWEPSLGDLWQVLDDDLGGV